MSLYCYHTNVAIFTPVRFWRCTRGLPCVSLRSSRVWTSAVRKLTAGWNTQLHPTTGITLRRRRWMFYEHASMLTLVRTVPVNITRWRYVRDRLVNQQDDDARVFLPSFIRQTHKRQVHAVTPCNSCQHTSEKWKMSFNIITRLPLPCWALFTFRYRPLAFTGNLSGGRFGKNKGSVSKIQRNNWWTVTSSVVKSAQNSYWRWFFWCYYIP